MTNLIYKRNFEYQKEEILLGHPSSKCYKIKFIAEDNSEIYADFFVPKGECKGIFLEYPDYKIAPKDYLNLSRYTIHNYAVISLHIRGQVGESTNNTSWSIYSPFLKTDYYSRVYQDALDLLTISKQELPNVKTYSLGVGQGAAIASVVSAISKEIDELFIANIDICDFETIYTENKDVGFYAPIRDYARNNLDKEEEMLSELRKIDVKSFAKEVNAKVHYGISILNPVTPINAQNNFLDLINNKEITTYRKFEKEVLQEHFFDEYVLKKLATL